MDRVACIILGGGRGTRLFPLTRDRAKPAVPLAGKYRLVDVPVSNCLNSRLNQIYLLTQFNTASLHRHMRPTYKFDDFSGGFVEVLAAEQTFDSAQWYQGTADAVRQNLRHFQLSLRDLFLILSGDQLYKMDFRNMIRAHRETDARLTIAVIPVTRENAEALGVMKINEELAITEFFEKPIEDEILDEFAVTPGMLEGTGVELQGRTHLASMGIYLFDSQALVQGLEQDEGTDFGKHIIPHAIDNWAGEVYAYPFDGYWEDIGTVSSFFEANLALTKPVPPFDFFDEENPVWTHPRYLPPAKINACEFERVTISDGSIIDESCVQETILGLRSIIRRGADIERTIIMGADFFETDQHRIKHEDRGEPEIGIGKNVTIQNAIIDKNARIGNGARIVNEQGIEDTDEDNYFIRDGIVVVPRASVIPPDATI